MGASSVGVSFQESPQILKSLDVGIYGFCVRGGNPPNSAGVFSEALSGQTKNKNKTRIQWGGGDFIFSSDKPILKLAEAVGRCVHSLTRPQKSL